MIVKAAKDIARQWVIENADRMPGFYGAFFAGSINELPDDLDLPPTSDVDITVVLADPNPREKLGKFTYRDVILEVTYAPRDHYASPDLILGNYHQAGSFRTPSVIADPSGHLTKVQAIVAEQFAKREWVYRRCEDAQSNILRHARALDASQPFHDQVTSWLFATGVTTHVLLVAGLKNPTVRRRYMTARELLAEYGRLYFYETLLELLGCAHLSRARAEHHLAALTAAFDAAAAIIKTPFPYAADISPSARPIAIDGSRDLIERGCQREAVFWLVATYARCQKVLYEDTSAAQFNQFDPGFRQLVGDLGITSSADVRRRTDQVVEFLPRLWEVAEAIMAANSKIED